MTLSDAELRVRINDVLRAGWIKIPDEFGYRGTGAPGKMLEELLDVEGGNRDEPYTGKWEIKFHSGSSLLTLFHLEGMPKGHLHPIVKKFGWLNSDGRLSFRHTVHGSVTARGFYVENDKSKIIIRNKSEPNEELAYWMHDKLINAFAYKFRRLVLVSGQKHKGSVHYQSAVFYTEPKTTQFLTAIQNGYVAIDFDVREKGERKLRNHGTKFRINSEHLDWLYHKKEQMGQTEQ